MASSALQIYATRDSIVGVMRWIGGSVCYSALKHWGGPDVQQGTGGELYLQTDDGPQAVPVNSYIVLSGKTFHIFSPEDLEHLYVKIAD